jgi:hypothetical protein
MIIRDLDIEGVAVSKPETDAPLIVDPNRMLARSIALESFEAIRRRQPQVRDADCSVQLLQSHTCPPQNIARQSSTPAGVKKSLGFSIRKGSDHNPSI